MYVKGVTTSLDEVKDIIQVTDSYKLTYRPYLSRGMEMINLSFWARWSTDNQYHPSKNAINMEKRLFLEMVPKLVEIVKNL